MRAWNGEYTFLNATGLYEADNYSTAEDIVVLLQYAVKNEAFRMTFTSGSYSTLPSGVYSERIEGR